MAFCSATPKPSKEGTMNQKELWKRVVGRTVLVAVSISMIATLGVSGSLAAEKVIEFGCAVSMSGMFSHEGELHRDGLEFWKDAVNEQGGINVGGVNHEVEIIYADDKSDTATSAKLVEKLITVDKVDFLFGPFGSGATFASSSVAEKYKVLMIAPMGSSDKIYQRGYKYLFSACSTVAKSHEEWVSGLLSELNPPPKTLAIIAQNSLWPLSESAAFKKPAEAWGLEIVYEEKYPPGTEDFSPLYTEIRKVKPDILYAITFVKEMIIMAKQLREMQVYAPMVIMPAGPSVPDFRESLGDSAEYIIGNTSWAATLPYKGKLFGSAGDYARRFKEKFGYVPDRTEASATVSGLIYQLAIERAGSLDTEKVREAVKALDDTTFYGPLRFDDEGVNVGTPSTILQMQGGKHLAVYPPAHAQAKLIYPMPK